MTSPPNRCFFRVAVPEQVLHALELFCYLFADLWLFGQ
jgi:hypothetical protein